MAALRRQTSQCGGALLLRKHFARNVRRLRKAKGLTQQQLADAAGINRTFISRLERGHFSATLETVAAVASALEMTAAQLVEIRR